MASEKLFKTFDDELIKSLDIQCSRNYYYYFENEKTPLKEIKIDKLSNAAVFKLEDDSRNWNELRKKQSLFIDINLSLKNVVSIFYTDKKVCHPNTKLGFGIEWKSKDSKIKFCKKLATIDNSIDDLSIEIKNIEIKNPDSDIEFRWFIYISKPGKEINDLDEKYANSEGLILAKELWWTILVSGNGSVFPIDEYGKYDMPLWSIRASFIDWTIDDFSIDNVAVTFNPFHPLYECINYGSDAFNEGFFKEVMSSALSALILQITLVAKDNGDYDDLFKEETESNGSILAAIKYFRDVHDFKVDGRPDDLLKSVKQFFDKEKSL